MSSRRAPRTRPQLEWLEDRAVPADLAPVAFDVLTGPVGPGDHVRAQYTLVNASHWPAGAFDVQVRLRSDAGNLLLTTFRVAGMEPAGFTSGVVTLDLPRGIELRAGALLGLVIDPDDTVREWNEGNNTSVAALAVAATVEQEDNDTKGQATPLRIGGDVAGRIDSPPDVDYYAIEIREGGYLAAEVLLASGSRLDARLELHGVDSFLRHGDLRLAGGGLLIGSDDRAPGDPRPLLQPYLLPGRYWLAVQGSGLDHTGDYVLRTRFTPADSNPHVPVRDLGPWLAVGHDPRSLVAADFNRDGILDLATANHDSATLSILLGADGASFQPHVEYPAAGHPDAVVAFDVNGDGRLDLVSLDRDTGSMGVLLGLGDGGFRPMGGAPRELRPLFQEPVTVPSGGVVRVPLDIADGARIDDLNVLLDLAHGRLADLDVKLVSPSGRSVRLVAALPGDRGVRDLVLDDQAGGSLATYLPGVDRQVLRPAESLAAFAGEGARGRWILEIRDRGNGADGVLRAWGLNVNETRFHGAMPTTLVLGDFNRDGKIDAVGLPPSGVGAPADVLALLVDSPVPDDTLVDLTGSAHRQFLTALGAPLIFPNPGSTTQLVALDRAPPVPVRTTPIVADLTGDGDPDVLVLSRTGDILLRAGIPGRPGVYRAPVVLNADPALPRAREVVVLRSGANARLAALDLRQATLSIYDGVDGAWRRSASLPVGALAFRLAAGDVNGDGMPDLVVGNTLPGTLQFYVATPSGGFAGVQEIKVGVALSDVQLQDLDGNGSLDVLVTDISSGNVGILLNRTRSGGALAFDPELRYHAGVQLPSAGRDSGEYGVVEIASNVANDLYRQPAYVREALWRSGITDENLVATFIQRFRDEPLVPAQYVYYSRHEPRASLAGDFDGDGTLDLVVLNSGTSTFSLLRGKAGGGFVDPVSFPTTGRPASFVAGRFDGDATLDLAIVEDLTGTVSVFLNDGRGHFRQVMSPDMTVGGAPTGVSLADVTRPGGGTPDGELDLLVGNQAGDLLLLVGNGDGTFRSPPRPGGRVGLAVGDLDGDGIADAVVTRQDANLLSTQLRADGTFNPGEFQRSLGADGLLAPGDVLLADLDGRHGTDVIVANSGRNDVLVYLRMADGTFAERPMSFFAGTSPTGLSVADLNRDGLPDVVVANKGSNDVSVLLGAYHGGQWALDPGPRLRAPGQGPTAVATADVSGDGVLDIVVGTADGTVSVLPGIGNRGTGTGFFNDLSPRSLRFDETLVSLRLAGGTQAVALTRSSLVAFDLRSGLIEATYRPGGRVTAFDLVPDRSLVVAASADGTLSVLSLTEAGGFHERARVALEAGEPTALVVLARGDDLLEVYVTDQGELRPVVVTIDLRAGLVAVGDPTQSLLSPVALATTLFTEVINEDEASPAPRDEPVRVYRPLVDGINVGGSQPEDETPTATPEPEEHVPVEEGVSPLDEFITGLPEALERLGWGGTPVGEAARLPSPDVDRLAARPMAPLRGVEDPAPATRDIGDEQVGDAPDEPPRVELLDVVLASGLLLCGALTMTRRSSRARRPVS